MSTGEKANILIVDDYPKNLLAMEAVLEELGENIVKANSGAEALQMLENQDFAAILLDVQMPVMDGFETASHIRKHEHLRNTPIIFITAINKADEYIFKGYSLGAVDYICKPVAPELLKAKVSAVVSLYHQNERHRKQQLLEAELANTRRLSFLSEASSILSASLDYRTTLANLARLVIPTLADYVQIFIKADDGMIDMIEAAHCDASKEKLIDDMKRFRIDGASMDPAAKVIRTGRPEIILEISGSLLAFSASNEEHLQMLTELGTKSCIFTPLTTRGQSFGAIKLATSVSGRRYTVTDLALAEELSRSAALAIDNARFYQNAQAAERHKDETLALLDSLLDNAPAGFAFLDQELRFIRINQRMATMNGLPVERLLSKRYDEVLSGFAAELIVAIKSVHETGKPVINLEITRPTGNDDQTDFLLANIYPVFLREKLFGIGILLVNISDLKRIKNDLFLSLEREQFLRMEAETASRIKDEFLATVSHELRTPLTSILGWSRLLISGNLDESQRTRALETLVRNAKQQAEIIDNLLDVSKIISGKLSLNIEKVDLVSVIQAAIDNVRLASDAKNIKIKIDINPEIGVIVGDPGRLQQVLWNLLANAVKYSANEGMVEISLAKAGKDAVIKIKDYGEGIKQDFLPFVFERFSQANTSLSRNYGGLGLGLAIVRHLIELHGGTVTAESAGERQGATFTVRLPLLGYN